MNKASIVIPLVGAALLALSGCSSDDSSSGATEEGLRAAVDAQYANLQKSDWSADYENLSARCQEQIGRDEYTKAAAVAYAGRDFSGPQQVEITMDGESATVVATSYDGKGSKAPMTWTYADGQWKFDNC